MQKGIVILYLSLNMKNSWQSIIKKKKILDGNVKAIVVSKNFPIFYMFVCQQNIIKRLNFFTRTTENQFSLYSENFDDLKNFKNDSPKVFVIYNFVL